MPMTQDGEFRFRRRLQRRTVLNAQDQDQAVNLVNNALQNTGYRHLLLDPDMVLGQGQELVRFYERLASAICFPNAIQNFQRILLDTQEDRNERGRANFVYEIYTWTSGGNDYKFEFIKERLNNDNWVYFTALSHDSDDTDDTGDLNSAMRISELHSLHSRLEVLERRLVM